MKRQGVMIAVGVGKPKDGPPPLKSLEEPEPKPRMGMKPHAEPDADEAGGPSDGDADNVAQFAQAIASIPSLAKPFSAFLEALYGYAAGHLPEEAQDDGQEPDDEIAG